jgi:hypothetical protein
MKNPTGRELFAMKLAELTAKKTTKTPRQEQRQQAVMNHPAYIKNERLTNEQLAALGDIQTGILKLAQLRDAINGIATNNGLAVPLMSLPEMGLMLGEVRNLLLVSQQQRADAARKNGAVYH